MRRVIWQTLTRLELPFFGTADKYDNLGKHQIRHGWIPKVEANIGINNLFTLFRNSRKNASIVKKLDTDSWSVKVRQCISPKDIEEESDDK